MQRFEFAVKKIDVADIDFDDRRTRRLLGACAAWTGRCDWRRCHGTASICRRRLWCWRVQAAIGGERLCSRGVHGLKLLQAASVRAPILRTRMATVISSAPPQA